MHVPLRLSAWLRIFEFSNPSYVPVEVREFSDITLSILDFNGNFIPFSNEFDTVVTLEMRPLHYK